MVHCHLAAPFIGGTLVNVRDTLADLWVVHLCHVGTGDSQNAVYWQKRLGLPKWRRDEFVCQKSDGGFLVDSLEKARVKQAAKLQLTLLSSFGCCSRRSLRQPLELAFAVYLVV